MNASRPTAPNPVTYVTLSVLAAVPVFLSPLEHPPAMMTAAASTAATTGRESRIIPFHPCLIAEGPAFACAGPYRGLMVGQRPAGCPMSPDLVRDAHQVLRRSLSDITGIDTVGAWTTQRRRPR